MATDAPEITGYPPLIERERELELVREKLAHAAAGLGAILVLESAPGHGKSALLAGARAMATAAGMEVLCAGGREIERDFSFGVALQLFETRIARAPEAERRRLMSGAARLAAPVLLPGQTAGLVEGHAFSILHGLYWLCSNMAERQPLAILIDDGDLLDAPTLRFLLHLAHRIDELPVAVLLSSPDLEAQPTLLQDVTRHPSTIRLRLPPFTREGVARFLRTSHFRDAEDSFCAACFEATGGNPLLVHELTSELAAAGLTGTGDEASRVAHMGPESIAATVLRRVHGLGDGAVDLARAVALFGDEGNVRHVARLTGLDHEAVAGLAERLARAGILAHAERLRFVHPVVRRAVHAERPPVDRAQDHLLAARIMAETGEPAERIAGHLLNADRTGAPDTVELLREAACSALQRAAPEAAVRYLRRALEEPPPEDARGGLISELGRAEAKAGRPEAVERLATAMELVEPATERARTALEIGRILYVQGRHDDAADAFRRGIDELGSGDEPLAAQLWAAHQVAARVARRPVELSPPEHLRAAGRDTPAGRLLLAQDAVAAAMRGEPREQVRETVISALGRGELLDEESADGLHFYLATTALTLIEDLQGAEFALTAAIEDARSRGSALGFATACFHRGFAILRRGRIDEAAADAENALTAQRNGWRVARTGAHAVLASTLMQRGDLDGAERQLAISGEHQAEDPDLSTYLFLATRARARMLRGEVEAARAEFLDCGRRLAATGAVGPTVVGWRSGAALATARLGDRAEARRLAEEELALARTAGVPGAAGRALTRLGRVLGDEAGLEALSEGVELLQGSQTALFRAEAFVDYGAALRRTGSRGTAKAPLREGLDLAQRLGARALAARARRELLAAGARPRRDALRGLESLSPRERQVAELATQGMSNREIAEDLFVTIKTVEWHLRRAYEKLGISSRLELRAELAGRATLGDDEG